VKAFYSDTFVLPLPETHRFPMRKYSRLRERLVDEHILSPDDVRVAPAADWNDIRLVHTGAYVDAVASGSLDGDMQRRIGFPWSPEMVERSRRSVGATLAAARAARLDGVAANLAGGTHHAFSDRGEGYCVFNDVAIAVRVLQRESAVGRVAIIDCDVHQGNGTASIFQRDHTVFTFSMHGAHNFPFRKEVSDLDVVFGDGAGDDEYLAALAENVPKVLDRHTPDFVFYVAGADAYEGDRLGRLKLTVEGLAARDRFVFDECRQRQVPAVVTMGGGYAPNVEDIVTIHCGTIRAAASICTAHRQTSTRC
jgi:acetoin utilization deacetylase AcuC-like enzyme